ncbi:MAG: Nif11-like leader peptide family natural product precursor [Rhodomicrobium sp.]
MSVESAIAYITRMREDKDFHRQINAASEDEAAAWALIRAHGYDFTLEEFNEAKDEIYKEFGVSPL